jgi:hypothetical protein
MGAEDIALRAGAMDRDTGTGMIGITSRGNTETMGITDRGAIESTMIGLTNRGDTRASTTSHGPRTVCSDSIWRGR